MQPYNYKSNTMPQSDIFMLQWDLNRNAIPMPRPQRYYFGNLIGWTVFLGLLANLVYWLYKTFKS